MARGDEHRRGFSSPWCLGVFGAVLPVQLGASVWTVRSSGAGGEMRVNTKGVIAAVGGKPLWHQPLGGMGTY